MRPESTENDTFDTAWTVSLWDVMPFTARTVKCLTRIVDLENGGHFSTSTSSWLRTHAEYMSPTWVRTGISPAHASMAYGQRARNAQPDGGASMFGGAPGIGMRRV